MSAEAVHHVYCYVNRATTYRDSIFKAFLTAQDARAYWAEHERDHGRSYEELRDEGAVVEYEIPLREYRKISKSGIFYAASVGTRDSWSVALSASTSGLVKKARVTRPGCTDLTLFKHSSAGGVFLVEGYPLPEGYLRHRNTALVVPPGRYSG